MNNHESPIQRSTNETVSERLPDADAARAQDDGMGDPAEAKASRKGFASKLPPPDSHPANLKWPPEWRNLEQYNEYHPARLTGSKPDASFNEDWARADFGDAFIDGLKEGQEKFRGDWWLLAMLLRCAESATMADADGQDEKRLSPWRNGYNKIRHRGIRAHLEHANLSGALLEHAELSRARLEYANLLKALLGFVGKLFFGRFRRSISYTVRCRPFGSCQRSFWRFSRNV